jgi:hypothetical protein
MAFDASVPVDVDEAVDAVDRKIRTLEDCALRRLPPGSCLPPTEPAGQFRSTRAMYNAVDSTVLRLEKTAAELPRAATEGRSHIQADLIDYDPGELFYKRVEPPMAQMIAAARHIAQLSSEFGDTCAVVLRQAELLGDCVRAEATLVSRAAKMAKPQDPAVFKDECEPLVDASADVSELKYDVDVRSPLHNHVMALADTAAALGWVVSPAALKHVRDYKGIITNLTEAILASYIDLGCNAAHSDFAEALNCVTAALVEYVSKEHPAGLRWNYAQGATPLGYRRAERTVAADAHPFGDFYKLIHNAVTRYYTCSREVGGPVAQQADAVVGAYTELAKVIETASGKVQPASGGGGELRMLLMSVQHELTAVEAVGASVPPRHKHVDHVNVILEFLTVMQWCTATINKMSPVSFIIDVQGVTNLYLDKLVIAHAGPMLAGEPYVTRLHREWAEAVRDMLAELLDYVKVHHPNGLMFDTRRSRRSMDDLLRSTSAAAQLGAVQKKSTSSKWAPGLVNVWRNGVTRQVRGWNRRG